MSKGSLIPERRRKHFPLNGGPKPTPAEATRARRGLDEARRVLRDMELHGPDEPHSASEIDGDAMERARRGIATARRMLEATDADPSS